MRIDHQRARQLRHLLAAVGQVADGTVGVLLDTDEVHDLHRLLAQLLLLALRLERVDEETGEVLFAWSWPPIMTFSSAVMERNSFRF